MLWAALSAAAAAAVAGGIPGHEPAAWWDFGRPGAPWTQVGGNATLQNHNVSNPVRGWLRLG